MFVESWISPKTQKGLPSKIAGLGFFAKESINKGEIVAIKAGHIIDKATLNANRHIVLDSEMGLADGLYLAPLTTDEMPKSMVYMNHGCSPNAGFAGNVVIVAIRDIRVGEEITVDYAMHMADPEYLMNCNCGYENCRGKITGNDWQIPGIQKRYKGYFAWYIQQKIDKQQPQ
jgi:SET domain-containing protein